MAAAFVLSILVAIASDYHKRRYIFILPTLLISVIGIIILLNVHDGVGVRYGALFLVVIGQATAFPIVVYWFSANRESNVDGPPPRSHCHLTPHFESWWTLETQRWYCFPSWFGACAMPIATFSVVASDAPKYTRAYSLSLGFLGFTAICPTVYPFVPISENRKRAKGLSQHSGKSREEKEKLDRLEPRLPLHVVNISVVRL